MEAQLLAAGIGGWNSLEDMEDNIILDELLLIHEALAFQQKMHYRMLASFQGINLFEDDEEVGEDLPEEVLEREREWKKQKLEWEQSGKKEADQLAVFGLGYEKQ